MAALIRVGGAQSPCPPGYGSPWMRKEGAFFGGDAADRPSVRVGSTWWWPAPGAGSRTWLRSRNA